MDIVRFWSRVQGHSGTGHARSSELQGWRRNRVWMWEEEHKGFSQPGRWGPGEQPGLWEMLKVELSVGGWGQVGVSVKGRPRYVWGGRPLKRVQRCFNSLCKREDSRNYYLKKFGKGMLSLWNNHSLNLPFLFFRVCRVIGQSQGLGRLPRWLCKRLGGSVEAGKLWDQPNLPGRGGESWGEGSCLTRVKNNPLFSPDFCVTLLYST